MSLRIDLNCDLGEGGTHDAQFLELISSANIACGLHAGDPSTMRRTVELAAARGVAIGAHPGPADAASMGRSGARIDPQQAFDLVVFQLGALAAIVRAYQQQSLSRVAQPPSAVMPGCCDDKGLQPGAAVPQETGQLAKVIAPVRLSHVKPHGTLYNQAATDDALATAIARAVRTFDDKLILFALAGSRLAAAGRQVGLKVAQEAFADRAYQADGTLLPRSRAGAVLDDPQQCVRQALRLVKEQCVQAVNGTVVRVQADTLCVHGDSPGALETLRRLRQALADEGIEVARIDP
jgi:UPF0271 protein